MTAVSSFSGFLNLNKKKMIEQKETQTHTQTLRHKCLES